jgi:hypothetical protein
MGRYHRKRRVCADCGGLKGRGLCALCLGRMAASCQWPVYVSDRRTGRDQVGTYSAALGWALVLHRRRHAA